MRIFLQWAKAVPEDWFAVDVRNSKAIRDLPKRPAPGPGSVVDSSPGWLCGLQCQGIDFTGYDHVAVEPVGQGLRITGWQDDPDDWPAGTRYAVSWQLDPPAPDPALGGRINTVQARTVWAEDQAAAWFPGVSVLPWGDFALPSGSLTLHGIWLPDDLFQQHGAIRSRHVWREWI